MQTEIITLPSPGTDPLPYSPSNSRSITRTINGSHKFVIKGFSLAKGIGIGRHIASDIFEAGGHLWAIYFYPDGKNVEDNASYVSLFVVLEGEGMDVRALFEVTLEDQSGKGNHKVHSHFTRTLEGGPYTLKYKGSMWGYKRFFKRAVLETSDYLKDDCLTINCTIGVVSSVTDCPRLYSVHVPDSDIGIHFGMLLENHEHSDVVFDVAGEKFYAHKLVLAARSPNFRAEFFDGLDGETNSIVITDLEPKVFKAMLHFIYTDTLVEDDVLISPGSSVSSVSDTLLAKLLASADKYGLDRLRLMCESYLCKYLSVDSVASILALADCHHAAELKVACLKYAAGNLAAVMRSDGFKQLRENCPSVQSELLKIVAGDEEESSSDSKNLSVQAQVVEGSESQRRRRVRPRLL